MVEWTFGYISQGLNVPISIEPNSWLANQPILRLISGMSIYKTRWIDGSVYSTVSRRSFWFRQLPKHRGKRCQLFLTFKPINKMAKNWKHPTPQGKFPCGIQTHRASLRRWWWTVINWKREGTGTDTQWESLFGPLFESSWLIEKDASRVRF